MTNYHRYTNNGPMSEWGHAMFAKGNPYRVSFYGDNHYTFDGNAPHIGTIISDIKARILEDVEQGYSNLDSDFDLLGITEDNIDEFVTAYNPSDVVDTAGAWDNSYLLAAAWSVLESKEIYAVLLDDGAIVFDESLINKTEWAEAE